MMKSTVVNYPSISRVNSMVRIAFPLGENMGANFDSAFGDAQLR